MCPAIATRDPSVKKGETGLYMIQSENEEGGHLRGYKTLQDVRLCYATFVLCQSEFVM